MGKRVIIIGAVAAGPKAACRLKRLQPDWDVLMLDQDDLIAYGGCGIPYYIGGDIADESELRATSFQMVRDKRFFAAAKGVSVLTRTRAIAIDRDQQTVRVQDLDTLQEEELPYDALLLATGAQPIRLPIPGARLDGVYTISNLHKAIAIKERLADGKVRKAVVIGGGAIGIEMAEALTGLWSVETALVEMEPRLLPGIVDSHFAEMLKHHLEENNVKVYTGESALSIRDTGTGAVAGVQTNARSLDADLVIMAVGVRPRSELAKAAGLDVTRWGGIKVNQRLQTSDPNIYAAGDCIALTSLVTSRETHAPLGSLANREGRIVADNIAGQPAVFKGVCGSFIMKAFDRCIGATGISYEAALFEGFDADYAIASPSDRAHFFPGHAVVVLQLVFDRKSRRILGLQAFGEMNDFISARVDAAAGLIAQGGTIEDFGTLEMAYAPPFSSAIDVINAAAYVADNLCDNRLRRVHLNHFLRWAENVTNEPDWLVLDLRHPEEAAHYVQKFGKERWLSLPYDQMRERYQELPAGKTLILICNAGARSYETQVFLESVGIRDTLVLCGGLNVIARMGVRWYGDA